MLIVVLVEYATFVGSYENLSDCKDGQNRFSIPKGNLRNQFLEDVEKVEKNQMVNIIDPSLKHYEIKLSNWKPFYALNGDSWKKIKLTNNLEPGGYAPVFYE
ncbi:hypothetical protein Leryth_020439 [Lithospermum erythrorhizon]|nr:hypothetical protein Leryth_020439 [Lithospermum erythrorhizon]